MLQINNKLQNKSLGIIIVVALLFISFVNMESNSIKIDAQEQQQQQKEISRSSIIELTAKLVDNEYRWIGSNNATNPTLNITSGVDNQITIKSIGGDPTKHELIIEGVSAGGKETEELISSHKIENGSSTTVNFNPSDIDTTDYESFEYYCEYHSDTMIGKVQIN